MHLYLCYNHRMQKKKVGHEEEEEEKETDIGVGERNTF